MILKYTYALDVLIPHIVHMTYFDYTLSVLQNFQKTIWSQKTWMKFTVTFFKINCKETEREKPKIQFF